MAQNKIIWSHRARIKLYSILEFYADRNKSKIYSAKLYTRFNKEIKLLARHPNLGIKTEIESAYLLLMMVMMVSKYVYDATTLLRLLPSN